MTQPVNSDQEPFAIPQIQLVVPLHVNSLVQVSSVDRLSILRATLQRLVQDPTRLVQPTLRLLTERLVDLGYLVLRGHVLLSIVGCFDTSCLTIPPREIYQEY